LTTIHNFSKDIFGGYFSLPGYTGPLSIHTNSDGLSPQSGLILSGTALYGIAGGDGIGGGGTVFKVNIDGSGFVVLHSFDGDTGVLNIGDLQTFTNTDGATPSNSRLVLWSNTLYGTAMYGGSSGYGTVFAVNTDGTGFRVLHSFTALFHSYTNSMGNLINTNSDGAQPEAGLIISGNSLYGTTTVGGSSGNGTVFVLNTDGTGFTNLHSFSGDSDGSRPVGGLLRSGTTLYGTTFEGTVFKLNSDGTAFTALPPLHNLVDGLVGDLVLSGNTLYGVAANGGSSGNGCVFRVNTDGTGEAVLYSFSGGYDGGYPVSGLAVSSGTLYGTTLWDGSSGNGTVFSINTNGSGFRVLHAFSPMQPVNYGTNSDGANPHYSGMVLSGNTLYGTADYGGSGGSGTIFSIFVYPQLTLTAVSQNVVLTWPTNTLGFSLQSTTNLTPAIWTTNLPAPVVVNGQYTVTNPISGTQQFFRLTQ
jgi:uncharacterized repeat protein (TIGR03803 family)